VEREGVVGFTPAVNGGILALKKIEFMEATTTEAKANRFRLREGDILITKDSESKDDIGIPAYVPADFDDVVCGYHLFDSTRQIFDIASFPIQLPEITSPTNAI